MTAISRLGKRRGVLINSMRLIKPEDKKHYHWHHIIPRYAGGSNDPDNLVLLSPLEHANAHLQRYEEFKNPADLYAAKILMGSLGADGIPVDMTGIKRPELCGDNNPSRKPGVGAKISAANKGKTRRKGYKLSQEHKDKIGIGNKGKSPTITDAVLAGRIVAREKLKAMSVTCPHCDKVGKPGPMTIWHFNNCKAKE